MSKRPSKRKAWSMFLGLLVFIALAILISSGVAIALGYTPRPRAIGWPLFLTATTAAVFTVDRWAKGLGVLFGTAGLNGLIIFVSGHALNQPSVPVPRLEGFGRLLLGIAASVTTARVSNTVGPLTSLARASCFGILVCTVIVMTCSMSSIERWELPTFIAFVSCLATLWAGTSTNRISRRRRIEVSSRPAP